MPYDYNLTTTETGAVPFESRRYSHILTVVQQVVERHLPY